MKPAPNLPQSRRRQRRLAGVLLIVGLLGAGPSLAEEIRAQLTPRHQATLAAGLSARIAEIGVREGQIFQQGQVLVQLDCDLVDAQRARTAAELARANHNLTAKRRLLELQSGNQLDVLLAQAERDKAAAEDRVSQVTQQRCLLKAPFSGRVADLKVNANEWIQVGAPLLDILDHQQLELEFIVPAHWLRWLKSEMPFQLQVEALGKTYTARIKRIGARVDPVSQSVRLYAELDGNHPELIPGMSGRVLITSPATAQYAVESQP
jgi:membrane fusion protein (multidrug efflux system)